MIKNRRMKKIKIEYIGGKLGILFLGVFLGVVFCIAIIELHNYFN